MGCRDARDGYPGKGLAALADPAAEVSKFLCNRAILCRHLGWFEDGLAAVAAAVRFDSGNPACEDIEWDLQKRIAFRPGATPGIQTRWSGDMFGARMLDRVEPDGLHLLNTLDPFRVRGPDFRSVYVRITPAKRDP